MDVGTPRIFALYHRINFHSEQPAKPYKGTVKGVARQKDGFCTKNTLQDQTRSGLERCGV